MDEGGTKIALEQLTARLDELERRVQRLETVVDQPPPVVAQTAATTKARPGRSYSTLFVRLAIGCFALGGALVLRVVVQQGWLSATVGTGLGLLYCAVLLTLPQVARRAGGLHSHIIVLPYCAVTLVPLIVLEMYHKNHALSPVTATLALLGFGLGGAIMASTGRRQRSLAALSLLAATSAVAGIGWTPEALAVRGSSLVGLLACALWVARREHWPALRPLMLVPVGLVLAAAVLMTGRRVPSEVVHWLLLLVAAVWLVVTANYFRDYSRLTPGEAAWFPLVTIWALLLLSFSMRRLAAIVALVLGLGLLAAVVRMALGRRQRPTAGLLGLTVASSGALLVGAVIVEPTGLLMMVTAFVLLLVSQVTRSDFAAVLSVLHTLVAGGMAIASGNLMAVTIGGHPSLFWTNSCGVGLLLLAFFVLSRKPTPTPPRSLQYLAPFSATAGLLVMFGLMRIIAFRLWGQSDAYQLVLSVLLALTALLAQVAGRLWASRGLLALGLVGVGLLSAKALLADLFTLEGPYLLAMIMVVGCTYVATSLTLARFTSRHSGNKHAGLEKGVSDANSNTGG